MIGPLTYLDALVLALASFSGLLALYRGFAREVLSILSWGVAAGAAFYFWKYHEPIARDVAQQIQAPPQVAQIGIALMIFLVVLVIVHLVTARISDTILDSRIGLIDRILGLGFGVLRGFVLVVIPYMFYAEFYKPDDQVKWVRDAKSLPLIQRTGDTFKSILQQYTPEASRRGEPQQGSLHSPNVRDIALLASRGIVNVAYGSRDATAQG